MDVESHHLEMIRTHAESSYPQECCGVLLGTREGKQTRLVKVVPTENSWTEEIGERWEESGMEALGKTQRERYAIAPKTLLELQKSARETNLHIVGFYHSHPDCAAIPSECDRQLAWPDYCYVIVSVIQGNATEVNAWVLDGDRIFQPEKILNTLSDKRQTELQ